MANSVSELLALRESFLQYPAPWLNVNAGQPVFSERPQSTFTSFIKDLCSNESPEFSKHLQLVKERFNALPEEIDDAEKRQALIDLQTKITSLGRDIFVKRASCIYSIFKPERLCDFEMRHFIPTSLPPLSVIKRGLPNPTLTLCWLNTALMYLSTTEHYDILLTSADCDPQVEQLRQSLCRLITALRTNANQLVINDLHGELCDALKMEQFEQLLDGQQDANEFLIQLQNALQYKRPHDNRVHMIALYESKEHDIVRPAKQEEPALPLIIYPKDRGEIDLSECLEAESIIEGISRYYRKEAGVFCEVEDARAQKDFTVRYVCTHLPPIVEIYVKRGHQVVDRGEFRTDVPDQKIKIDGPIVLTEYEPIETDLDGVKMVSGAKPKTLCSYEVIATIERMGKTTERGHYAANAITSDGVMRYNDMSVEKATEAVFKDAYLLQLRCIAREPIKE